MVEPTETESKETLEEAAAVFIPCCKPPARTGKAAERAPDDAGPPLGRGGTARNPRLRYLFPLRNISDLLTDQSTTKALKGNRGF